MPPARRLALTAEIVSAITSGVELEEALRRAARWTAESLGLWECDVYSYDPESGRTTALGFWTREPRRADMDWIGSIQELAEQPAFQKVLCERGMVASHIDDPGLAEADRARMQTWGEKSCLLLPLLFDGDVIGFLELVERRRLHRFTSEEGELADTVATLVAVAIHNARTLRDQDERNRQLTSLVAASRTVSSTLVLEDVLGRLAQAAVEALTADVCYIYEYLPQEDAIAWQAVFEHVHGPQAQELGTVFPLADFPSDREVLERGVIVEENISDEDLRPTTRVSMEEWGQKTLLSVPLVIEGEPAGLFEVGQLERERHFTPQEVEFVGALGEQAAVAINNARQYRATERRNERLVRLVDLSQALATSLDGGQIVERLESGLRSLFPNRTCVASVRPCAPDEPRAALKGLAKEAVRQHRPIQRPGRMSGRVVAPLFSGRRLLGLLQIVSEPRQPFAKDEIEIIQLVANQTAAAMENSRLYTSAERMAITDGLTGLYNHRYFYERLAQEVARARRYELPLSLLMIDIDDFKRYNDRLGHRAGDALLRGLAALLLTQTRQQVDLVARYGGEEFAIILPSTGPLGAARLGERLCDAIRESTAEDGLPSAGSSSAAGEGARGQDGSTSAARAVGERIRHTIEKETFGSDEAPPVITVSVGVASMPDHATTVDGLVEEADDGLYRAKDLGKNRVEVPQVQAKQTR